MPNAEGTIRFNIAVAEDGVEILFRKREGAAKVTEVEGRAPLDNSRLQKISLFPQLHFHRLSRNGPPSV